VSDYADDIERVRQSVVEVALDWLAVGLDPEGSHFVIESLVPENAELTALLSWFVPLARLQRNPTLKAELSDLDESRKTGAPVGFFIYPVMQVANILLPRASCPATPLPTSDDARGGAPSTGASPVFERTGC
jgi:tryptophanyl-tRNA synthetase